MADMRERMDWFQVNEKNFGNAKESILEMIQNCDDFEFSMISEIKFKNVKKAILLSVFGGLIGLDRFYIGDTLIGFIKFASCGGLFFLWFMDMFLIKTKVYNYNYLEILKIFNPEEAKRLKKASSKEIAKIYTKVGMMTGKFIYKEMGKDDIHWS